MAEEEPSGVLRVKRSDDPSSFAVIHVYSRGSNPLDLELIASEGQSAWSVTIREAQIAKLRASNNHASDKVWEAILKRSLLLEKPSSDVIEETESLEPVVDIALDGAMSLIFRRNIGELTQRLGTIVLKPTEDDKFDLWSGCAAGARLTAQARQDTIEAEKKLAEQIEISRKLESQLQELIQAKEEHEDALLHKFTALLNAKKMKIRDQQRLLSTAKLDSDKVEKASHIASQSYGSTQATKRKATSTVEQAAADDESSDGFESVEAEDEQMRDAATPEPPEDDETDDDDNDVAPPPPEPKKGIRRNLGAKPATGRGKSSSQTAVSGEPSHKARKSPEDDEEPPPRRELPFAKKRGARETGSKMSQDASASQAASDGSKPAASNAEEEVDTTDDDEL